MRGMSAVRRQAGRRHVIAKANLIRCDLTHRTPRAICVIDTMSGKTDQNVFVVSSRKPGHFL